MTGGPDGGCEDVGVVADDGVAVGDGTAVAARLAVADGDGVGFGEAAQATSRHAVPAQAVTNPIETFICVITRRNSMHGVGVTARQGAPSPAPREIPGAGSQRWSVRRRAVRTPARWPGDVPTCRSRLRRRPLPRRRCP